MRANMLNAVQSDGQEGHRGRKSRGKAFGMKRRGTTARGH